MFCLSCLVCVVNERSGQRGLLLAAPCRPAPITIAEVGVGSTIARFLFSDVLLQRHLSFLPPAHALLVSGAWQRQSYMTCTSTAKSGPDSLHTALQQSAIRQLPVCVLAYRHGSLSWAPFACPSARLCGPSAVTSVCSPPEWGQHARLLVGMIKGAAQGRPYVRMKMVALWYFHPRLKLLVLVRL